MRNANKVRKAAMGALVAAALMAGVGQAGAVVGRFPDQGLQKLPDTRVRIVDDGSSGLIGTVRIALAAAYRFPVEGGVRIRRWPASRQPRIE
jgi:hypothetical protein